MGELSFDKLTNCPNCGNDLADNVCTNCGSTIYDFCGEHVRNHNGKTYIRFITQDGVAEVLAQVSSHKVRVDTSKFPDTAIAFDLVGGVVMAEIKERRV